MGISGDGDGEDIPQWRRMGTAVENKFGGGQEAGKHPPNILRSFDITTSSCNLAGLANIKTSHPTVKGFSQPCTSSQLIRVIYLLWPLSLHTLARETHTTHTLVLFSITITILNTNSKSQLSTFLSKI